MKNTKQNHPMSFNSKDAKSNLQYTNEKFNNHDDSRTERTSSAPPVEGASFSEEQNLSYEEPKAFEFVLTKSDGSPLEIESSEEESNSELNISAIEQPNAKIIEKFSIPAGDWEMELEITENSNEFGKFMSIQKLIGEFAVAKDVLEVADIKERETVPVEFVFAAGEEEFNNKVNGIVDLSEHVNELNEKLKDNWNEQEAIDNMINSIDKVMISNDLISENKNTVEAIPSIPAIVPANFTPEDWDFEFESEEQQNLSDFVKFMQIEKLILQFPQVSSNNVADEVNAILKMTERTPIDIKFLNVKGKGSDKACIDSCTAKINSLKNKVYTPFESIRIEFNRATASNVNSVIENIKAIQVEKIEEMREIASFVFEKIISEPIYFDIYLQIVGQLRTCNWKCTEELLMAEKTQTCFFGTLLSFAKKRLDSEHDWFAQVDESAITSISRGDLEEQIEDKLSEKTKKREHALGTVNFLVSLYLRNITGLANAQMVIDKLLSRNSAEHIVMICYVYKKLVEKLVAVNRNDFASRIISYLKTNEKTPDLRLQIVIEKALKYNPLINCMPVKQESRNSFANLNTFESESEPAVKSDSEVLQTYITHVASAVTGFSDDDEVLEYGDKVYKDIDRFNNKAFFIAYLIELVSNFKSYSRLLDIFLKKLLPKAIDLPAALSALKEEMDMLSIDVACSSKHFAEVLCHLRSLNKISKAEFDSFKLSNFSKHSLTLFKKWKETDDSRLAIVASEEEIQKLN